MEISKLYLKNPITHEVVDELILGILEVEKPALLLLNFGDHNFESLEVLKYCKEKMLQNEATFKRFEKIAMVSVPPYRNPDKDQMRYFHSEQEAEEWLGQCKSGSKY